MSMRVHYINLRRRPDRNEAFLSRNANIADFQRVEGVDGTRVSRDEIVRDGLTADPPPVLTAGAIGIALTHRRLWREAAEQNVPMTVAEDDAIFNCAFSDKAAELIRGLPPDWDYILWGWNFDSVLDVEVLPGMRRAFMWFDRRPLGTQIDMFQKQPRPIIPLRLYGAFGFPCYSVSAAGARKLLERCFPMRHEPIPIPAMRRSVWNVGLDTTLNKFYVSMNAVACFPPLVWTENDRATSDIQIAGLPNT